MAPAAERLRVTELFVSIQGESTHAGRPCVFVRLTGCALRCAWCDTRYAYRGGTPRTVDDVLGEVGSHGLSLVEITGGEPLLQPPVHPLMRGLLDLGQQVLLETSGSRSIAEVPPPVHVIMDLKPPGSGEVAANRWENVALLRPHHEVKIPVSSREDWEWAIATIRAHDLLARCPVSVSPVWGHVEPAELARWLLDDRLDVRLNLQLHKLMWGPDSRGV